jgi:hypothetical protein
LVFPHRGGGDFPPTPTRREETGNARNRSFRL